MTHPADESQDRVWLADTLTRIVLRYGRALHALSMVPAPLTLARLWDLPEADDVQQAAVAIVEHVGTAIDELSRLSAYAEAITSPGQAVCVECGARVSVFHGREGFEHWGWTGPTVMESRVEIYDAGHAARPSWPNPPRPDWRSEDTDLAPEHPTENAPTRESTHHD